MKRRKNEMMKYFLIVAGILTMCVPDNAGWLQFVLQGVVGLAMFIAGISLMLQSQDDR
jgi:predicted Na+-dependent transporter